MLCCICISWLQLQLLRRLLRSLLLLCGPLLLRSLLLLSGGLLLLRSRRRGRRR